MSEILRSRELLEASLAASSHNIVMDRHTDAAGGEHIKMSISLGPLPGLEGTPVCGMIMDDLANRLAGLMPQIITNRLKPDDKRLELAPDDPRLELDAGTLARLELEAPDGSKGRQRWLVVTVLELLELARQCHHRGPALELIAAVDGVDGVADLTALERLAVVRVMLEHEPDPTGDLKYAREQLQTAVAILARGRAP